MIRSLNKIDGYKILAIDGEIGEVTDFYFDEHSWTIRYIVADTGNWLVSNKVLISPVSLKKPGWENKVLPVNLTKKQVEESPKPEKEFAISRQHEMELAGYYGWPNYWMGTAGPMATAVPITPAFIPSYTEEELKKMEEEDAKEKRDHNLRSSREVTGYNINAADGTIGHLEDFLFDDDNWNIKYLVVDTKNILPGKKVIVALQWITKIDWFETKVYINLTKEKIEKAPVYEPDREFGRKYEEALYTYYGKKGYWK